jgi:hypothetical protein
VVKDPGFPVQVRRGHGVIQLAVDIPGDLAGVPGAPSNSSDRVSLYAPSWIRPPMRASRSVRRNPGFVPAANRYASGIRAQVRSPAIQSIPNAAIEYVRSGS